MLEASAATRTFKICQVLFNFFFLIPFTVFKICQVFYYIGYAGGLGYGAIYNIDVEHFKKLLTR